ncbi:outer membrane lipoprotein-sorting protein [bacterium]|nr:outer membrane lipoprotein-sorting protein [bacterium]
MKRIIFLTGVIAVIVVGGQMVYAAENSVLTGRDIAIAVDNRPDGDERKNNLTMTLVNKRGRKRIREIISYSKEYGRDSKSIMVFKAPADVKGTGFLQFDYDDPKKDDDKWLYMPALRKTRRISGAGKNDYFMGSDFTYDDMGNRNIDEDIFQLLKEEEREGNKCWVLQAVSKDKDYMYSKKISWINKDNLMPIYVEYYGRQGRLLKTLHILEIKQVDGFWTIMKMKMENKVRKHSTILEFSDVQYNQDLKDSLFRINTLERGRIR